MGDATVQNVIRRILNEHDGELSLLDLVMACDAEGLKDAAMVADSLLPLIYNGTVEFTRQRNLRLRDIRETEELLAATA